MNHKVNTIHNHGWLIQEQPTPKQWVRLLRKYLSLLDWPIDGRFPIIYYSENGWNKNWAFYSCIQYLLYIYYICHRKFRWKIVAFIATWLYSIPRIHNPVWPRRRRPDRRWGMDPLNPWIEGNIYGKPMDFPNMGTKTNFHPVVFWGYPLVN